MILTYNIKHGKDLSVVIPEGNASALKIKHDDMIEWDLVSEGGSIIARVKGCLNPNISFRGIYCCINIDKSIYN
jgi:hypothetical protein